MIQLSLKINPSFFKPITIFPCLLLRPSTISKNHVILHYNFHLFIIVLWLHRPGTFSWAWPLHRVDIETLWLDKTPPFEQRRPLLPCLPRRPSNVFLLVRDFLSIIPLVSTFTVSLITFAPFPLPPKPRFRQNRWKGLLKRFWSWDVRYSIMHVFFCDETITEKINGGSLYMQPHRLLSLSIFPFHKARHCPAWRVS